MVGVPGQVVRGIRTPEGTIQVEIRGPREAVPPVVCLHGLSANRVTWRPLADRLDHRFRFLLPDLLGRGDSDPAPESRYDLASEVRRLRLVLDRLEVRHPLVVGHSHGAAVAVAAARPVGAAALLLVNPVTPDLARPRILTALGFGPGRWLVSPLVRLFRRPLTRYMLVRRVFAEPGAIPPGVLDRYAAPWADSGRARGLASILADWDPAELEGFGGPLAMPAQVIAGERDRRISRESARRWATALGAGFQCEAGCGHSAPEERTGAVAAALEGLARTIGKGQQEETLHDQE